MRDLSPTEESIEKWLFIRLTAGTNQLYIDSSPKRRMNAPMMMLDKLLAALNTPFSGPAHSRPAGSSGRKGSPFRRMLPRFKTDADGRRWQLHATKGWRPL